MQLVLGNFHVIRPKYEAKQEDGLKWIAAAHAFAKYKEELRSETIKSLDEYYEHMKRMSDRFSCGANKIQKRGTELSDFFSTSWEKMRVFNLNESIYGANLNQRMAFFEKKVTEIFEEFYCEETIPPSQILHVTCTGYASPSAAQVLVSHKDWGAQSKVIHIYHMGCYASIPAIHIAQSHLQNRQSANAQANRVDIIHNELCTLHFNPAGHDPEQFVVQSLFSDGHIKYSLFKENYIENLKVGQNYFEILATHEVIYPNCLDAMSWKLSSHGFQMTVSRRVPSIIAENIENFLKTMFEHVELSYEHEKEHALYAVHPGGPRIIDNIRDILQLPNEKFYFSHKTLFEYGNMSSATLPHVWSLISKTQVPKNTLVVSLAFGPGLTICGMLMRIL